MDFYTSSVSFGICADVAPYSKQTTKLLNIVEPLISKCNMPNCSEVAVRVGIYATPNRKSDGKFASEFRGLCERHKQQGMYIDNTWGGL